MSNTLRPYVECVRSTLRAALCLQSFPCQQVERQSKPEVEAQDDPELLLEPLLICRNASERCLIEGSINSARISLKVKQVDALDEIVASTFLRFLMLRADSFGILRKVPVEGCVELLPSLFSLVSPLGLSSLVSATPLDTCITLPARIPSSPVFHCQYSGMTSASSSLRTTWRS